MCLCGRILRVAAGRLLQLPEPRSRRDDEVRPNAGVESPRYVDPWGGYAQHVVLREAALRRRDHGVARLEEVDHGEVVAVAAEEHVGAGVAGERVVAGPADEDVAAGVAPEAVLAGAAVEAHERARRLAREVAPVGAGRA